ncbi:glycine cleavage T C-terminal barrel domain-containing protein [Roseovarius sp. ZX-A-9]|uniref:glycine cleavage T C-terminal barrel domain-containing protein n=1 Tax=Roseovarius sp. ZX-A-9 TaxID=3014783 RepID=UPI00233078DD|nr:glycine cleavage T C-terminal barrel domain-containing protein [Roseovarius sp. ZX-A-9]
MLDDAVVRATTSLTCGHSVGHILAFAYVKPHANVAGNVALTPIAAQPRAALILTAPAHDPSGLRPRSED